MNGSERIPGEWYTQLEIYIYLTKLKKKCDKIHETLRKRQEINKNDKNKPYCNKLWVPNKITSRIQRSEITFFRETKGGTNLDHIRKGAIGSQLQIYSTHYKIQHY